MPSCNISQYVYGYAPGGAEDAPPEGSGKPQGTQMARRKSALEIVQPETSDAKRRNPVNLFESAYLKIEELLVNCALRPGRFLTVQELQSLTGFGRTPVHAAVNRLAADTLIIIRPRHGLQIAPIDLARERLLLGLRRDIERFVIRLAAERAGLSHRNQMLHIERVLRERRATASIDEFNQFDRRIDALILSASEEPFLVHSMRPLHTIYRRIGYIYHRLLPGHTDLTGTIDRHLAILDAVANRRAERAVKASDTLIDYMDQMFEDMESGIDPGLLDCSIEPLPLT
jgi:DNA-binding GntR family transcriptional regulator